MTEQNTTPRQRLFVCREVFINGKHELEIISDYDDCQRPDAVDVEDVDELIKKISMAAATAINFDGRISSMARSMLEYLAATGRLSTPYGPPVRQSEAVKAKVIKPVVSKEDAQAALEDFNKMDDGNDAIDFCLNYEEAIRALLTAAANQGDE